MEKEKTKETSGVRSFIRKLILFILAVEAAAIAVMKLVDYFRSKKADDENPGRDFKRTFNYFGRKNYTFTDTGIAGIISRNIVGSTSIDLSDATFREDGFISLASVCAAIYIVVPRGVNVKLDGMIKCSAVDIDVPETEGAPTLYIASNLACSSVFVTVE